MDGRGLHKMISRLGERAGVAEAHPHRFRHTFAINFLGNGGNVFALQRILGHESLEMVTRYLSLAQTDLEKARQDASPVANWLLWSARRASRVDAGRNQLSRATSGRQVR